MTSAIDPSVVIVVVLFLLFTVSNAAWILHPKHLVFEAFSVSVPVSLVIGIMKDSQ